MDGFHLDNATLEARGLLSVKGAPETFDLAGFKDLIDALVSGATTGFPTFDRDLDSVVAGGEIFPKACRCCCSRATICCLTSPDGLTWRSAGMPAYGLTWQRMFWKSV